MKFFFQSSFLSGLLALATATPNAQAASTAPAAPSALSASAASTTQINLRWTDNSSNEQGFIVQRSLSSTSGFVQIASVGAGVMTYSSTSLSPATTYYYRVVAYAKVRGQVAYSNFSNIAGATTLSTAPSTTTTTTLAPTTTTLAPTTTTTSLPPSTTTTTLAPPAAGTNSFYVSPQGDDANPGTASLPFRTIARAQSAVRVVNQTMTSDIFIYLRGGTYTLSSPVTLTGVDSGFNGKYVHYAAYPGEKPVISGGSLLTGWISVGNGIYKTSAQGLNFRELYVNGVRATRSRWPNGTKYHVLHGTDWSTTTQQFTMSPLPFTPAADGTGGGIEVNGIHH